MTLHAQIRLNNIRKNASSLNSKNVRLLFERCKENLGITRNIIIKESSYVTSPMTFGLFKTYILLPKDIDQNLSLQEVEYILLHELQHFKCRHIQMNYLFVLYQIVYWFQPFVWWAFKEMKADREMACDAAVLQSLDKPSYKDYGTAIINFADRYSRAPYSPLTNQFFVSKKHLKRRIFHIATFHGNSTQKKLKSIVTFFLLGVFVAVQIPVIAATDETEERYNFQDEQAIYEDMGDYFERYEGSFVLYNMQQDQYYIHNQEKSTQRVSPNSTYKIYSALFALQQNVISFENSKLNWDGTQHSYDLWNMDQNLNSAMKNSVTWYFQELDKQMQKKTIQSYLEQIQYGNKNLSGGINNYWLESSLKISPIEQVQLLKEFYTNQFEFKEENIKFVKNTMKLEENNGAILYGKTGTGNVNGKNQNGWFIGFVETEKNTFFFATNIQHETQAYGSKAAEIALSILRDKQIYGGE
jgi:bla regulator protein BlaR1